jgi:hypothetical protein
MSYRLEWAPPCHELLAIRCWRGFDEAAAAREAAIAILESGASLLLRLVIFETSPDPRIGMVDVEESFPDIDALRMWLPEARLPCSTLGSVAWRFEPAEAVRLGERLLSSIRAVGDWGVQSGLLSEDAVGILCGTAAAHLEEGLPIGTTRF